MTQNIDKSIVSQIPLNPSSIETVDFALYDYINETLNLFTTTNKGWKKVPVVWAGQERAYVVKNNPDIKDINNSLIFPIISIERGPINKSTESKGKFYANIPPVDDYKGGSIVIGSRIKQDKTANFANNDAYYQNGAINFPNRKNKIVYEVASMPQPVYYECPYKVNIKTEYQQQMNELVQPFIVKPGSVHRVMIKRDNYRYEAFIQPEFEQKNNTDEMTEESRSFETTITIKVFGYVIGGSNNEEKPFITIRETAVEIKVSREHSIVDDRIPWINGNLENDGKYRP
jgi:hypothetical protein